MLLGHLDLLTSSGYVEGWAVNLATGSLPLYITVTELRGRNVAAGTAHRFREDLAAAGMGNGWCAFRLKVKYPLQVLHSKTLLLRDGVSKTEIHRRGQIPVLEDDEPGLSTIAEVLESDPTVVSSLDSLMGCDGMFNAYIKRHGVDAFIRATYVYILGRPVDPHGLILYGRLIRKSALSPFALVQVLADSDEFRSRPRLLSAPITPGFPFQLNDDDHR